MPISSAQAAELLNPAHAFIFYKELEMEPLTHPQVVNVTTSRRAYEESMRVSGLGTLVLKAEGTPVAYDEPVIGDRKRTLNATYALGYRVPMELVEDDQHGIVAQFPADLADATKDHTDTLAAGPYNDAFAGGTFTGMPEGGAGTRRSLCNTGHVPLKTTGTQSNRASPGVALSVTGIQDGVTNMRLTQSEEGRDTPIRPTTLLHHPNDAWTAAAILESEHEPFTAENQINTVKGSRLGISPVDWPKLTDTDAWFLLAEGRKRSVKFYRRKPATFDRGRDMDTFDSKFTVHYRAHPTFDDWRGVYGSAPGL